MYLLAFKYSLILGQGQSVWALKGYTTASTHPKSADGSLWNSKEQNKFYLLIISQSRLTCGGRQTAGKKLITDWKHWSLTSISQVISETAVCGKILYFYRPYFSLKDSRNTSTIYIKNEARRKLPSEDPICIKSDLRKLVRPYLLTSCVISWITHWPPCFRYKSAIMYWV